MPTKLLPYTGKLKGKAAVAMAYQKRQRAALKAAAAKKRIPRKYPKRVRGKYVKVQRIKSVAGNMSQSILSLSHKPTKQVKELKDIGVSNVYIANEPIPITGSPSDQQCITLQALGWRDLYQMGGSVGGAGTFAGPRRYVLESLYSDVTFTNQTSVACEVEIIDFACKQDVVAKNTYVANGLGYTYTNDPKSVWTADQQACLGTVTPTYDPTTVLGSKPFDGQLFPDLFKVLKRSIVMLPQGGTHRHVVNLKPNRIIHESMWNSSSLTDTNATLNFAGLTQWTMIIARGVPTNATGTASGINVATAAVNIAAIRQLRYKWTWCQDNSKTLKINNVSQHDNTAVVKDINIGSGQPETQQIAV